MSSRHPILRTPVSARPFDRVPRELRLPTHVYVHLHTRPGRYRFDFKRYAVARPIPQSVVTIEDLYLYILREMDSSAYAWRLGDDGDQIHLRLEVQYNPREHTKTLRLHVYTEALARKNALKDAQDGSDGSDDGSEYYRVRRRGGAIAESGFVRFPTRTNAALTIQKAYRGFKGRRLADEARDAYYRPGARGYLAAERNFYTRAAQGAASRAAGRARGLLT